MNGMVIVHGGPSPALSFRAELDGEGRRINLNFKDGRSGVIEVGAQDRPIELICPCKCGGVMWCMLADGAERFYETGTGSRLYLSKLRDNGVARHVFPA